MSVASDKLAHLPVAIFTTLMGLVGLALSWKKAVSVFSVTPLIYQSLVAVSILLLLILSVTYLKKFAAHPDQVRAEFMHPVKISFFPAFSIGLMLIAAAIVDLHETVAALFWSLGVFIHLSLTLFLMNQWVHHRRWQIQHTTPAWFIPIVGNIIAPLAGVSLGFIELSWFFFSVGIVYWVVLKVLVFNRIIFHDPLPERLLPTLFILVAPPAVGFIAYTELNGGFDNFAHILYYTALFLVLLLTTQLNRFLRLPFFISWWAYTFPIAAFTVATQMMYEHTGAVFFQILSLTFLAIISLIVGFVAYKTLRAAGSGALFTPD